MNDKLAVGPDGRLRQMKLIALGLLVLAGMLYVAATALQARHPAWRYVAAFAEAAMVGAIADWFAVVALFRHPLGLPIPHTAIIPSNKDRIGQNLANFICNNFLSTPQVLGKLEAFDPAGRLATWLSDPAHAAQVGRHLASGARYGLDALDDDRVRHFVRDTVLARLERVDLSRMAGQLLDVLTAQRRHHAVLDEVLLQLATWLEDPEAREQIAQVIAREVKYLRFVGLDNIAGNLATAKLVAGLGRVMGDMSGDPQHPLRTRFDAFMHDFVAQLKDDPAYRLKGEEIKADMLRHPALAAYLHGLWSELLAWLHDDLQREDSSIRARIAQIALTLGDKLKADTVMQEWINKQVYLAAPYWIERYREDIRHYITSRVAAWNTEDMTGELERNVGRDLQFVRINGTLVGGLVGLLIHALTQWAIGG